MYEGHDLIPNIHSITVSCGEYRDAMEISFFSMIKDSTMDLPMELSSPLQVSRTAWQYSGS
jgi:hypothetical protein